MKSASFYRISAIAVFSACALGCSPSVDVTRVVSQDQAAHYAGSKMMPAAIVHADGSRTELTPDTTIVVGLTDSAEGVPRESRGRAIIPKSHGAFVVHVGPNDVIQVDTDDRITGVRSADGHVVAFVPGTAFSPEGSDEVRGHLAGGDSAIELAPADRVEISGTLGPDDRVQGLGHVESSRYTFALVFGGIATALAYAPVAVVGAESSRAGDRVLFLPIFGPWIDLLGRDKCITPPQLATDAAIPTDPCVAETANRVGIVISGIAQAIGGTLFLIGLPEHAEWIEDEPGHSKPSAAQPSSNPAKRKSLGFSWSIVPLTTPTTAGLSAVGRF
ncbi:MAG: hypothetical protein ABI183_06320 [Polyangiaceae bacterium]